MFWVFSAALKGTERRGKVWIGQFWQILVPKIPALLLGADYSPLILSIKGYFELSDAESQLVLVPCIT